MRFLSNLCLEFEQTWGIATIPVVSDERLLFKLRRLHEDYNALLKQPKARMKSTAYLRRLHTFKKDSSTLFDVVRHCSVQMSLRRYEFKMQLRFDAHGKLSCLWSFSFTVSCLKVLLTIGYRACRFSRMLLVQSDFWLCVIDYYNTTF